MKIKLYMTTNNDKPLKIAFWDNCLCERGTTVALYDYAYYNRKILGNESIILYNTSRIENNAAVIDKFKKEFAVFGVPHFSQADNILTENGCDVLYIIKAGDNEGQVSRVVKTVVHCVFSCSQPHGDIYASIAPWVPANDGKYPHVPHLISLPDNDHDMRKRLGIPEDATVFGRHGGYEQFDIPYVHQTVYEIAKHFRNIYFLFVNTRPFCPDLPNIIHLGQIIDLNDKVEFINTCDAMIWARSGGEVFSLSQGEFSIRNKPIITTNCGADGHVHLLGNRALWYNQNNLYTILVTFDREEVKFQDWNAYREYTPEKVMNVFKDVFLTDNK